MNDPILKAQVNDGVALLVLGDTVITLWREPATMARWQWQWSKLETVATRAQSGIVVLSVILESSSPPDAKLRAKMQEDFRRLGSKLRKLIAVPLGTSVWAAVVRTLVRGVLLLSGESHRQEVAGSLDDGLERVAALATPSTPSSRQLREGLHVLFEELGVVDRLGISRAESRS